MDYFWEKIRSHRRELGMYFASLEFWEEPNITILGNVGEIRYDATMTSINRRVTILGIP